MTNNVLEQPLDEEDPSFAFTLWTEDDQNFAPFMDEEEEEETQEQLKQFQCYIEDNEAVAIQTNNQQSAFWLNDKLKGVYFFDTDDDPDLRGNYLIQHVTWPVRARGANKGWRAAAYKLAMDDETAEWKPTGELEEYFINEVLYTMIKTSRLNKHLKIVDKTPTKEAEPE
jgi:hypothetical protein